MADAGQGQGAAAGGDQENQQRQLRSIVSQVPSYVRFVNRTQHQVNVYWLDYKGVPCKYKRLVPGERYNIKTYVTHPWIARDSNTSTSLLINSEEVYFPKAHPVLQEGHRLLGPACPHHITAVISIPLYTLRDRAAQVVLSCLQSPEEANYLDIPKVLKNELVKVRS